MLKKAMILVLALSVLLCFAACGKEAAPAETTETAAVPGATAAEEAASTPAVEEKRLDELIADTNPANQYETLAAALEICQAQFDLAVESTGEAGLAEDATLTGLILEWGQELEMLHDYLAVYADADAATQNALDTDAEFLNYADYFLLSLAKQYNMTRAMAKDPSLWLTRYTTVSDSMAEPIESDGSWPQGYFFSDRVPTLASIDRLMISYTGKDYGFEDGTEYSICVNEFTQEQALAYIDQLIEMGFREDSLKEISTGVFLWFGRLDDSEGHISAIVLYNATAAGTAADPAFLVQFYNCDMIGVLIDIGSLY